MAAVYETGRYMFVFNTKLCQKDKAAQVATRKEATPIIDSSHLPQLRIVCIPCLACGPNDQQILKG